MRVKATQRGFYDNKRRKIGEVFELKPIDGIKIVDGKKVPHTFTADQLFSKNWMVKLDSVKGGKTNSKKQESDVATPANDPMDGDVI